MKYAYAVLFGSLAILTLVLPVYCEDSEIDTSKEYYSLGKNLVGGFSYEAAISEFTNAIELEPKFADAYNARGNAWLSMRHLEIRFDNACSDFYKACKFGQCEYLNKAEEIGYCVKEREDTEDLKGWKAHAELSISWHKSERYELAIEGFTKAYKLKPDYTYALDQRGLAYLLIGQYRKSIKDFNKSLSKERISPDPFFHRGYCWQKIGDHEKAIKDFTRAIELYNDRPFTSLHLDSSSFYIKRGKSWVEKGNLDKACSDFNKACELGHCNQKKNNCGAQDAIKAINGLNF